MATGKILVLATDSAGLDLTEIIFPTLQCLQKERSGAPADIWLGIDDTVASAVPFVKPAQNGVFDRLFVTRGRVGWPILLNTMMDEVDREENPPEFVGVMEAGVVIDVQGWLAHAVELLHEGEGGYVVNVGVHGAWEDVVDPQKSMHMHDNVFTLPRVMGMGVVMPWYLLRSWRANPYGPLYAGMWEDLTDHIISDLGALLVTNAAWDEPHGVRHTAGQRLMIDTCAGHGVFPMREEAMRDDTREGVAVATTEAAVSASGEGVRGDGGEGESAAEDASADGADDSHGGIPLPPPVPGGAS
jgi:hypothetical protein